MKARKNESDASKRCKALLDLALDIILGGSALAIIARDGGNMAAYYDALLSAKEHMEDTLESVGAFIAAYEDVCKQKEDTPS